MPMIHPNRMIDMAMPMKLAVILLRSVKTTQVFYLTNDPNQVHSSDYILERVAVAVAGLTECVPLILPYCLGQIDWQISGQR